ncbi:di-trans,poly-cis-decaprenylcistransferase [Rhodoferax aquaticus]|uniref:Isoprenyl transferase n=2 Tax=Rhodoferax aquaticus TaxID=2527691 RepID=A0A515EVN9_9BURK|nr:di-trans,poly-cis-decaprenylcistransferase [Rhodoferax aquaticus]
MDGNGRWASKRFLPRVAGHRQGVESLKRMVKACVARGVSTLTVFAFSSENWNRPVDEVSGLMDILVGALAKDVTQLEREGVRLFFPGSRAGLSERVLAGLSNAERLTSANTKLMLNVCFNFGGRWDIVQAASALARAGELITDASLSSKLALAHCEDPDLLIRTGGEKRLSNFLLWQCAYSELVFSDALWPDFDEAHLDQAIEDFAGRERRYGMTSGQLPLADAQV